MTQDIDRQKIALVLTGKLSTEELNDAECEVWLDLFTEKMAKPTPEEEAFFADRRARGVGVGLDPDTGTLKTQEDSRPPSIRNELARRRSADRR